MSPGVLEDRNSKLLLALLLPLLLLMLLLLLLPLLLPCPIVRKLTAPATTSRRLPSAAQRRAINRKEKQKN